MSKSLMIIDTPKSCEECTLCVAVLGKHYCAAKGTNIIKGERDCSCPLVAVPKKINVELVAPQRRERAKAWNNCIDKIMGGSSE